MELRVGGAYLCPLLCASEAFSSWSLPPYLICQANLARHKFMKLKLGGAYHSHSRLCQRCLCVRHAMNGANMLAF